MTENDTSHVTLSNSLPTGKSFQSNAQKFPRADKFYQGCYSQGKVREKQKFFKVREKSGNFLKSQGTLFSDAMHQGCNGPLKAKLNLSERFQPGGVFCFENRASVYFDTAIY